MPAFGNDGLLDKTQIGDVVQYVLEISGQPHDADKAGAGAQVFADNCVACHGEMGAGDRAQGAPNLTDAIWLYGGNEAALTETVTKARFGVMPAWTGRLSEAQIRSVAYYVHGLGGGE
jgi:cytochrome c oxidase cbb3-type subunit 3